MSLTNDGNQIFDPLTPTERQLQNPPNHNPTRSEMKNLLSKTSTEVKEIKEQKRSLETVDIQEIYDIYNNYFIKNLNQLSIEEIYIQIGLSKRILANDKSRGFARKVTKYALIGYIQEQNQQNQHNFTYEELTLIFTSLLSLSQLMPLETKKIKNLQKIIANLISKEI